MKWNDQRASAIRDNWGYICEWDPECKVPGDCDDQNVCTMEDFCSNGICAGVPLDQDEDGYATSDQCGGNDCDDSNPNIHPGVSEAPPEDAVCEDGIDNNCHGYTDGDDIGCVPSPDWATPVEADASAYGSDSGAESSISNLLLALTLPIGAVILLRRLFRKR